MNGFAIVLLISTALHLLLFLIGPAFIGYGIALLIRGRSDPHAPMCEKCSVPLTRDILVANRACATCGSSPIIPIAQRTRAILRGVLFIVLPIATWLVVVGIIVLAIVLTDE